MNKSHVTIFAILVAATAVLGTAAVTRTTGLGRAARNTNDAAVASRTKQLEVFAAKLKQQLKAKPPALPKIPKLKPPVSSSPAAAAAAPQATAAAPRIVYHRPPPIIHTIHRHHGDDDSHEGGGGGGRDD
jgi:hypothetical protein